MAAGSTAVRRTRFADDQRPQVVGPDVGQRAAINVPIGVRTAVDQEDVTQRPGHGPSIYGTAAHIARSGAGFAPDVS